MGTHIPERVAERALNACVAGANECHISTYSVASHGYAQIGWKAADRYWGTTAHRAAWVGYHGEQIPDGLTVDHICCVRRCVNPRHMRLLSNFENARRTHGRDWPLGQCASGHPNEVLRTKLNGGLICSLCVKIWSDRYALTQPSRTEQQRQYRVRKKTERALTGGSDGGH